MTRRACANLVALVVSVVLWVLFMTCMVYILLGGLHPYSTNLTAPTPNNNGPSGYQVEGLLTNYHLGMCIYVEPDECEDI